MRTVTCFCQQEACTAPNNLFTERDEGLEHVFQSKLLRTTTIQRHHVTAEALLQLRVAIELVHDDVRNRILLQLNNNAHALTVRLIANIGDTFDTLLAHKFCDLFDHCRLVDLIRDLGDDDRHTAGTDLFRVHLTAHNHGAAAILVSRFNSRATKNNAASREVGARNNFHQLRQSDFRALDHRDRAVNHFTHVVRWNIGRHTNRNTASTIDQKVRIASRKNFRLLLRTIVVLMEVDRIFVDIGKLSVSNFFEATFGVTHRRSAVTVNRAKVTLPVNERQTHGEILRHTNKSIINRTITVWVILTHNVTNDAGGFTVGLVPLISVFMHGIQNTAVNRLQTITNIGKRTAYDHAHRIIEIAALHFICDRDGPNVAG